MFTLEMEHFESEVPVLDVRELAVQLVGSGAESALVTPDGLPPAAPPDLDVDDVDWGAAVDADLHLPGDHVGPAAAPLDRVAVGVDPPGVSTVGVLDLLVQDVGLAGSADDLDDEVLAAAGVHRLGDGLTGRPRLPEPCGPFDGAALVALEVEELLGDLRAEFEVLIELLRVRRVGAAPDLGVEAALEVVVDGDRDAARHQWPVELGWVEPLPGAFGDLLGLRCGRPPVLPGSGAPSGVGLLVVFALEMEHLGCELLIVVQGRDVLGRDVSADDDSLRVLTGADELAVRVVAVVVESVRHHVLGVGLVVAGLPGQRVRVDDTVGDRPRQVHLDDVAVRPGQLRVRRREHRRPDPPVVDPSGLVAGLQPGGHDRLH